MKFVDFIISRIFLKNFAILLISVIILILGAFIWLKIYTHHNQSITVPDLTGLDIEDVKIITESKKVRFEVTDSIFYSELPKGSVVKQNPKPGSQVKENRRIYLTINAVNPEKTEMPTITGVSLRQARAILETYGLKLGKISYKPDIAVNVVLKQIFEDEVIESGTLISKGSEIDLILGKGLSNKTTKVPNLIGFSLLMARNFVADRYLNIGAIIYDNTMENQEDSARAFIWRQRPEFEDGSSLQLGDNVDIWLTIDSTKLPLPEPMAIDNEQEYLDENFD